MEYGIQLYSIRDLTEKNLAEGIEKMAQLGIPMVVESETCNPSGIAEAEICIKYLKGLEK